MAQYIVWTALTFKKSDEKEINIFFKKQKWGRIKFVMQFKTKAGKGGLGGRNDVVFKWFGKGDEIGRFSIGRLRMGGISWLGDYVNNNRDIIPDKVLYKLRIIVKKTGDYQELNSETQ